MADQVIVDTNANPLTVVQARAAVAAGDFVLIVHPNTYLRMQVEKHGGFPLALVHWEDRIQRLRAQPKPRLPR